MVAGATFAGFVLIFVCGGLIAMGECFHRIEQNERRRRREEAIERREQRARARMRADPAWGPACHEEHLDAIVEEGEAGSDDELIPAGAAPGRTSRVTWGDTTAIR